MRGWGRRDILKTPNLRGRLHRGETASLLSLEVRCLERWIGFSKDKLKNAESLQGMRSMRKTGPFGSKPPRVGKSGFEKCNRIQSGIAKYTALSEQVMQLTKIISESAQKLPDALNISA